jgi:hypothetical protein
MNTATQLLERVKAVMSMTDLEDIGLYDEIETYLAKPQVEQEPVGYVTLDGEFVATSPTVQKHGLDCGKGLYTSPQAREQISEDDIRALWKYSTEFFDGLTFARAIEAHHGIKAKS